MYFKDIIGQEEIKKQLIHSAHTGVVPHAQLFTEQGGAGAFPLALAYARYLNCTHRTETDACGTCPSCLKYNELVHPDLHFVFPIVAKKEKKKERKENASHLVSILYPGIIKKKTKKILSLFEVDGSHAQDGQPIWFSLGFLGKNPKKNCRQVAGLPATPGLK